jgi:hypothetical protein
MVTFAMLLAGTNLVINVADAIPRFDVAKTCKAAIELVGQGRTVESCVAGEDKAREGLGNIPYSGAQPVHSNRRQGRFAELCRDHCLPRNDSRLAHAQRTAEESASAADDPGCKWQAMIRIVVSKTVNWE